MKWYPWLSRLYIKIIQQHQKNKAHHAILINTQHGLGINTLIWNISKWILCLNRQGIKSCHECSGCLLMMSKNHPDWMSLKTKKNNTLHIDYVRFINQKIFQCAHQGGAKIIFLSDIQTLTESAINAMLKVLEEPPNNTWFFLINYNSSILNPTLYSRCLIYKLFPPSEKISLTWLIKENLKKQVSYSIALKINEGSPIKTRNFIKNNTWQDRLSFYKNLFSALKEKNLFKILPLLSYKNSILKIDWICLLLLDSIKFNLTKKYFINFDQSELIQFFSHNYTNIILDNSLRSWIRCRYRLINISGINYELLLLEQLFLWEKILNISFK